MYNILWIPPRIAGGVGWLYATRKDVVYWLLTGLPLRVGSIVE